MVLSIDAEWSAKASSLQDALRIFLLDLLRDAATALCK